MDTSLWTKRRRRLRIGMVLALASTASAVTLNDLQPVQDGLLSVACSMVYNSFITGCTSADFTKGQTCSLSCIAGVKQIEDSIEDECQGVQNSLLTLLSDAQHGSLIVKLCVGNSFTLASTTSTFSTIKQTSTIPLFTNPLTTTSQTIGSFSTIPFPTTTPTTTFIQTTPVQTTPLQSTATETTITFVAPSTTSTFIQTTSQTSFSTSETAVTQSSTSTSTGVTSTSTSTSQSGSGVGGGSPFDTTSGSSKLVMNWSLCLAAGVVLASLRLL